jgi:hypothetical protein
MNDTIRPGVFSSQVIAGWLQASSALRKNYGGSLDIFQLTQGDAERAGAAVFRTRLSLASLDKSVSCLLVLQASAFDQVVEYLQFRDAEAQKFAVRYAEDALEDLGVPGLIAVADHSKGANTPPAGSRLISEVMHYEFSNLRPDLSPDVDSIKCGLEMEGLFRQFNCFEDLHAWETETESVNREMYTVSNADGNVVAGCSFVGVSNRGQCLVSSPFVTETETELEALPRFFEKMLNHILAIKRATSGILLYDSKDPFRLIVEKGLASRMGSSPPETAVSIWGIPSGLSETEERAILASPFQVPSELLSWNLFKKTIV